MARPVYGLVITWIELGPTKQLPKRWRMNATRIGLDNDTAEAVPIVGSRPAKYVELGGGLPVLAITGNAENARRVSCPGSLPGSAPVKSLVWTMSELGTTCTRLSNAEEDLFPCSGEVCLGGCLCQWMDQLPEVSTLE